MTRKQKLELTWIGKDARPKLEPRILLEDPSKSYHAKQRVSDGDIFDNRLIFGDNLLALKALEQEFAGKVKCIFIFHQRVKTTGFQPVSFSCENEEAGGVRWTTDTAVTRYFRSSITLCG